MGLFPSISRFGENISFMPARHLHTSETAVRQRLFSARQKIKSKVEEMAEICNKPVVLNKIEFNIWGVGNPLSGDPSEICTRQFSKHIVWLGRKKSMSASEIAAKLGVPTIYVEEELEILTKGMNGEYGLLRRQDNGKYAINFILFDKEVTKQAVEIYAKHLPEIGEHLITYIEKHKAEYLAFPYLNKKPDLNLILWQQISVLARRFVKMYRLICFQIGDLPTS